MENIISEKQFVKKQVLKKGWMAVNFISKVIIKTLREFKISTLI